MKQYNNLTISQMRELKEQYEKENGKVQELERFNSYSYKRERKN